MKILKTGETLEKGDIRFFAKNREFDLVVAGVAGTRLAKEHGAMRSECAADTIALFHEWPQAYTYAKMWHYLDTIPFYTKGMEKVDENTKVFQEWRGI
jgi:hypothetical protein